MTDMASPIYLETPAEIFAILTTDIILGICFWTAVLWGWYGIKRNWNPRREP